MRASRRYGPPAMSHELQPPVRRQQLSAEVRHARAREDEIRKKNDAELAPAIEAHFTAYDAVLAELEEAHRRVPDSTDVDLVGQTRPAATWAVCGRSISLGLATVSLLRAGFALDVIPTVRTLHETNRLLEALRSRGSDGLLRDWLTDARWVGHKRVLAVRDAAEQEMRVDMIKQGIRPPAATMDATKAFYERLSEFAHNRRRHLVDAISPELRQMPLGPHPDIRVRAATVGFAGDFIAETVTVGGAALADLLGREWFVNRFNRTFHALQELQRKIPLDPATVAGRRPSC
jgi:hypothetical protein